MTSNQWDIVILGAGCAGMSLAYRLAAGGYQGSVLVLDRREDFHREQRWCTWGPIEPLLSRFVSMTWKRFRVTGNGKSDVHRTPKAPYLHIHAPSFFREICAALSERDNFMLRLGVTIDDVSENEDGVCISVNGEPIRAKIAFEARNEGSGALAAVPASEPWLWQSFAGHVVLYQEPIFDSEEATLMDFDVPGAGGGSFMYLLPFSSRSALVESTLISTINLPSGEHERRVERYLSERIGKPYSVQSVETGAIPMTTHRFPARLSPRRYAIGISGGGAKPSTGYAFARIQAQTARIADALLSGRDIPDTAPTLAQRRRAWLDDVFVDAASHDENVFRTCLLRMFHRVPTASTIRFLSENSTIWDELMVMASVGEQAVVKAAARRALGAHL